MTGALLILLLITYFFDPFHLCIAIASNPPTTIPTLPLSGDATELPSTNLTLQYVAVGRGTQNYTCTSLTSSPVQQGAVAVLYNATRKAYYNETALNELPPYAVYVASLRLEVLGHHFFDSTGTPTFDLYSVNKILYGSKTGDIKAPVTANKGPAGTGAVDWLQLTAKKGYPSIGLSVVYRVVTAGGQPSNCTFVGVMMVDYAAEYWFY